MRSSVILYWALGGLTFGSLLVGCGGAQSAPTPLGAVQEPRTFAESSANGHSWMLPEAKHEDLLYVANQGFSDLLVFAYPKGKPVGKISGFGRYPFGLCVDREQNIWVASETQFEDKFRFTEYAHGGRQRKGRVDDPMGTGLSCAIDPTSGNLAIVNRSGPSSSQGNIALYSFASHSITVRQDPKIYVYDAATYDDKGDLFVAGLDQQFKPKFAELPQGTTKFIEFKLSRDISRALDVLWDGQYVVVAGPDGSQLYRYSVAGTVATLHDKIGIYGESNTSPSIAGSRIVGGDLENNIYYWDYPQGGDPTKVLHGGHISEPGAVAISLGS